MTNLLLSIQQLLDRTMIFYLQRQINENNMQIILLKNDINQSNQNAQLFIKKLLSRYFSDCIIKILIKKYHNKFSRIILTLNNIYEIISTYGLKIISDDNLKSIKNVILDLTSQENDIDKEQYLINYINDITEKNRVMFIESIEVKGQKINQDELNFVLGALLYFRKIGNIIAHPNIESKIDIEIKKLQLNLEEKLNIKIKTSKDNNSLIDMSLKNEIQEILNKVKDNIVDQFKEITFNKNAELEHILKYKFENDTDDITNYDYAFLRALKIEIDKILVYDEDYDENKIFNNVHNIAIYHCNKIINNINEFENLLIENLNEINNFEFQHNKIFENLIKPEIDKLKNLNFITFTL